METDVHGKHVNHIFKSWTFELGYNI